MQARQIQEASLSTERGLAKIKLKSKFVKSEDPKSYMVVIPKNDPALVRQLDRSGAKVTLDESLMPDRDGGGMTMWIPIFFILIVVVATMAMITMSYKRSRALSKQIDKKKGRGKKNKQHVDDSSRPQVSFTDVAGCDEAVREISEFLVFL